MPDAQGNPTIQDYQQEVQNAIQTLQTSPDQHEVPQKLQAMQQLAGIINSIGSYGMDLKDPTIQQYLQQAFTLNIPAGQVSTNLQKVQDYVATQGQASYQQKQYQDLINKQNEAYKTAQTDLLAKIPQYASDINTNLTNTEAQAMTRIEPQLESRLNALGLLQSGALPQAQAQAQAGLDQQRQNEIQRFITQADQTVGLGLPIQELQSQVGNLAASTQGNIDLSQGALTNSFNLQNTYDQNQFELQLQQEALANARQLAKSQQDAQMQDTLIAGGFGLAGAGIGAAGKYFAG